MGGCCRPLVYFRENDYVECLNENDVNLKCVLPTVELQDFCSLVSVENCLNPWSDALSSLMNMVVYCILYLSFFLNKHVMSDRWEWCCLGPHHTLPGGRRDVKIT